MADGGAAALWDFAVAFYGAPEVQRTCLALQDEEGADVPLLIFAIFAGTRGQTLDEQGLRNIDNAISDWRSEVVHPLRHARRALRAYPAIDAQNLRESVKRAELEAERQQLETLAEFLKTPQPSDISSCVRENLRAYAALGLSVSEDNLTVILTRLSEILDQ
jgi:uncharacterized protein (TIGR02444 family)